MNKTVNFVTVTYAFIFYIIYIRYILDINKRDTLISGTKNKYNNYIIISLLIIFYHLYSFQTNVENS